MKEVSEEKFNRILEKHIDLKPCKRCGYHAAEIVVRMPIYGRYGACVRCSYCGEETKTHGITYVMTCGKKMATPTIKSSLMGGIERAVQDWNRRTDDGQTDDR